MDFFWEKDGWEHDDRHLKQLRAMPFQRSFPFIPAKNGLYIVRGPRQIGKSCWLKQVLLHYSKKRVSCYYQSCEELEDYRELSALLKSLSNRKVVLLDEISFVDKWDRAVKHAVDAGQTNILMVTGSHAFDLKRGSDRMPGRFDGGGDFNLLPMSFSEFQQMRAQAGWRSDSRLEELRCYFRVGGFPTAVSEGGERGKLIGKTLSTYWKWLAGDVVRLGKQESYLSELLVQLASVLQTPTSLQNICSKTGIGSHNTVSEYIEVLEACFAVRSLLAIDLDTGAARPKKNRKIYFTDPLIYWLALDRAGIKAPADYEQKLAELVAHEALAQGYRRFGYFSNQNGEIDFVKASEWALEIKWSPVATKLSKSYYTQMFPWKSVWTQDNFLVDFPPTPEFDGVG